MNIPKHCEINKCMELKSMKYTTQERLMAKQKIRTSPETTMKQSSLPV